MDELTNPNKNKDRRDFLLTFFNKPDKYEIKEVNGFYLVKQFNSRMKTWNVALYKASALMKRLKYNNFKKQFFK